MKTTLAIVLLTILTQCVFAAPPPAISYLTDEPIDEVLFNSSKGRIIILAADASVEDQNEVWALWMDPRVVDYFEGEKNTIVIYLDEDTHQDPYLKAINVRSLPSIVQWNPHRCQRRMETFSNANELLRWLRNAKYGTSYTTGLYGRVANDPDNIQLRFELITELEKEDSQFAALQLLPWLVEHNDTWFRYEKRTRGGKLEEENFKQILFHHIKELREATNLFAHSDGKHKFTSWVEYYRWRKTIFYSGSVSPGWMMSDQLDNCIQKDSYIRSLESAIEQGTATDRDLFILKALTSEGEEWESMIEQYTSSNEPTDIP